MAVAPSAIFEIFRGAGLKILVLRRGLVGALDRAARRGARRLRFGAHPAMSPHKSHDYYVLRRLRVPSNRAPGAISKVS